jgi:hypothetical protein
LRLWRRAACCSQPVFELLLWSVEQLQEHRAPTFELGVSILQTISQVGARDSVAAAVAVAVGGWASSVRAHIATARVPCCCAVPAQTKSYFVMLDWGDEDVVLDWVRALLQCIK